MGSSQGLVLKIMIGIAGQVRRIIVRFSITRAFNSCTMGYGTASLRLYRYLIRRPVDKYNPTRIDLSLTCRSI